MANENLFTGTSTSNNVVTGLSTQILISVDGEPVGAIQQFNPTQDRRIRGIPEIGTDGFVEKVPHAPTDITIRVNRIVFDQKRMTESFARAFVNISSQRVPFDILVFEKDLTALTNPLTGSPDDLGSDPGVITHAYRECWFSNLATTYRADDYIIAEDATISCLFAVTYRNTGVGKYEVGFNNADEIERTVDASRRGSLDAAGLALVTGPSNTTAS